MKTLPLALSLALAVAPGALAAQQPSMPDMPGMSMPAPAPKPKSAHPVHPPQPADPMPADMQGMQHDTGDRRAQQAGASEQHSVQQQAGEAAGKPADGSDAISITIPTQQLQEPEAIGFHTGSDLPAPDLLLEVVARPSLTLESFLTTAEQTNPTLAQARSVVERSRQQAIQAGLPPNPSIGYSGDHIRGGSYHGGEEGAFVSQEFLLGRKLALRRQIYVAQGRSSEFAFEAQRARIHNDVASAFVSALAAQQAVTVADRLLQVALDAQTNAHELERVGQADAATVLTAEIAAEQAKIDFVRAQRLYLSSFTQLATLCGQPALPPHPLAGALVEPPQIDAEALAASNAQQSPLVSQAEADLAVNASRLKDAQRERIPNLTVKAGEWYSGETLGATNGRAGWESFAEAGVQIPLWNRNQGNIAAARAELTRAQQEVSRTQLLTRHQAAPFAQQYLAARFTVERYRTELLPRARRAYQLETMKYQQMAQPYARALAAQHLLFTLQAAYIQALTEEWHAAIALQNFTLSGALEPPADSGMSSTSLNLPTGGSQ